MAHTRVRGYALVIMALILLWMANLVRTTTTNTTSYVPPEELHVIPMRFGLYFGPVRYGPNSTADVTVGIWVRFYGTLTVGKEATLDASGYLNSTLAIRSIDIIDVFFKLSLAYPLRNDSDGLPQETRLSLYRTFPTTSPLFEGSTIHIFWPNPGDYSPTVNIVYWNHSEISADLPVNAVHVEPISESLTESVNRVNINLANTNTTLTYLLLGFAALDVVLAAIPFVEDWSESRKEHDSELNDDKKPAD
jgi:hypothetical protein